MLLYIRAYIQDLYRDIGYLNNCPIQSSNIGYWTPKVGRVTVEYLPSFENLYSVT